MECYFCRKNIREVDFKNAELLGQFISARGKIKSRRKTGTCAKHQRKVAKAIKRARIMSFLPFVK